MSRARSFSGFEGKVVESASIDSDKKRCKVDNLAVLQKARTDLDDALRWCEKRLASMEGDYLRRWPNVLNTTPRQASIFTVVDTAIRSVSQSYIWYLYADHVYSTTTV